MTEKGIKTLKTILSAEMVITTIAVIIKVTLL